MGHVMNRMPCYLIFLTGSKRSWGQALSYPCSYPSRQSTFSVAKSSLFFFFFLKAHFTEAAILYPDAEFSVFLNG